MCPLGHRRCSGGLVPPRCATPSGAKLAPTPYDGARLPARAMGEVRGGACPPSGGGLFAPSGFGGGSGRMLATGRISGAHRGAVRER